MTSVHTAALRVVDAGSVDQLDCPPDSLVEVQRALDWARTFLTAPNPAIGRSGPVCPYVQESFARHSLLVAWRPEADCTDEVLASDLLDFATSFAELRDRVPADQRHLVAVLIMLSNVDPSSATPLDELHANLKGEFVRRGLMIGQFHPRCDAPGLWHDDFRPLQSPVPLLAVRGMVASDLPFLLGDPDHATTYFSLFAPAIPAHVRRHLVARLVQPAAERGRRTP